MFNLINILGQNTLPEQVEINKQNIAILADEVEKLGYQPKGVYDAETEYNHNDVVFYDNKLYVVTSDAAIVGVLPTNTTYWQQVTGDIRGQQGAQGAPGAPGADGADGTDGVDGKPVLWYNQTGLLPNQAALNTLLTESSHSFTKAYFSRVGDVGDEFIYFIYIADSKTSLAMIYKIATWPEGVNSCTAVYQNVYASMTGQKGDTGATGKEALVYGRKINFTWNGETEQLLSGLTLSFQDFNRVPELNEDFVAILHDTLYAVDYLAMGEIQTKSNLNVTSIVATDINRITGMNGTNGTNGTDGTDGKDALVYNTTYNYVGSAIVESMTLTGLLARDFNRTPIYHEYCILVCKATTSGRSFIAICRVDNNPDTYVELYVSKIVETTGAAGQGTTLNRYTFSCPNIQSKQVNSNRLRAYNILNNAKGRVSINIAGYTDMPAYACNIANNKIRICGSKISSTDARSFLSMTLNPNGSCDTSYSWNGSEQGYNLDGTYEFDIIYYNDVEITA